MEVVIADKDSKTRKLIERTFKSKIPGYSLISTDSGKKCISTLKESCPDLTIVGSKLCDISGFDLVREIRCFSSVPIMFISSDQHNYSCVKAINIGVDKYITKPIHIPVLASYIESLLRRTRAT